MVYLNIVESSLESNIKVELVDVAECPGGGTKERAVLRVCGGGCRVMEQGGGGGV